MANEVPSKDDRCDVGLSIEEREQITAACRTIHEILLRHNMVKTNWSPMTGTARDGRVITHKFTIGGYVKTYPANYDISMEIPHG